MKYVNSQKGIAPVIIVLVLAIILAGVGGAYYLKQQKTKNPSIFDETDKMYQVVQTSTSPDGSYSVTYSALADYSKFTIQNKQGVIIFDNLLDRIYEDIWVGMQNVGLKGRGQVGYEISSWINNSKFVLRIFPANGEKYEAIVDAKIGIVDKESFRKIE